MSIPSSSQPAVASAAVVPSGPSEEEKERWLKLIENDAATPAARVSAANSLVRNFADTPEGARAQKLLPALEEALAYERLGSQWQYLSSEEGMTGKAVRHARVLSTNQINLDFPYGGPQRATLTLRRHPRWGNDVIFAIERGQILCHSYGDCKIQVKFDDGKVLRYDGNPPADNSSESVFIPAFSTFTKQLPKAKNVKIEVSIYQGGNRVFDFDVSGFKPEKFK